GVPLPGQVLRRSHPGRPADCRRLHDGRRARHGHSLPVELRKRLPRVRWVLQSEREEDRPSVRAKHGPGREFGGSPRSQPFRLQPRSSQSFTAVLKDFKLLQFNTCAPKTTLTKQICDAQGMNCAASKTVNVGDSVVYKYTESSNGNVEIANPHVIDDTCSPVTVDTPSGDTDGDGKLDPGETWHFKCTKTNVQADATNTALGHG